MKKLFKIKYLHFLAGMVLACSAVAAEGPGAGPGNRWTPEERQARIEQCKADPEKCRAEFLARREQWCKDNAERCQEIQARIEKRIAECKADPQKCQAERQARREQWCKVNPQRCKDMQARMDKRAAECKSNPEQCRAERQARFEQRFNRADSDGNGMLSRDEVQKAVPRMAHYFDAIDANGDGHISKDELMAARQKVRHIERPRRKENQI